MMSRLFLFAAVAIALIGVGSGFQQKQLRCSNTESYESSATNFKLVCQDNIPSYDPKPITDRWKDKLKSRTKMLDFIEHCTCSLLSMSMVWETMLTHEVEILFAVSRDFVDEFDEKVEKSYQRIESSKESDKKRMDLRLVRRSNRLFAGDDGDSLYHYYVLNYVVSTSQSPNAKAEFFDRIIKRTAGLYFDLKHLESSYTKVQEFPMDHPFTLIIGAACKELDTAFGPYLEAISMMRSGFKNEMWMYRVISHDETLFKLVISSMLCKVVNEKNEERGRGLVATQG